MAVVPIEIHSFSQWAGCVLGLLLAVIVQGEARPYFVALSRPISANRGYKYDINPFHHLDILVVPIFLLTGWGWSKSREVDLSSFGTSKVLPALIPMSVPIANFALAGIIGSLYIFFKLTILKIAVIINVQMAVANLLIPLPPMALGQTLCNLLGVPSTRWGIDRLGFLLLLGMIVVEYATGAPLVRSWVFAVSDRIAPWVLSM